MRWTAVMDEGFSPVTGSGSSARKRLAPQTGTVALKNAMDLTNEYMLRNHGDTNMFATTFFAVLDPATGQLNYINGGHNPPVVIGPNGIKDRLKPTGPAPGMLPDVDYRIGQTQLDPGDILFTFTDGVTDARNPLGRCLPKSECWRSSSHPPHRRCFVGPGGRCGARAHQHRRPV